MEEPIEVTGITNPPKSYFKRSRWERSYRRTFTNESLLNYHLEDSIATEKRVLLNWESNMVPFKKVEPLLLSYLEEFIPTKGQLYISNNYGYFVSPIKTIGGDIFLHFNTKPRGQQDFIPISEITNTLDGKCQVIDYSTREPFVTVIENNLFFNGKLLYTGGDRKLDTEKLIEFEDVLSKLVATLKEVPVDFNKLMKKMLVPVITKTHEKRIEQCTSNIEMLKNALRDKQKERQTLILEKEHISFIEEKLDQLLKDIDALSKHKKVNILAFDGNNITIVTKPVKFKLKDGEKTYFSEEKSYKFTFPICGFSNSIFFIPLTNKDNDFINLHPHCNNNYTMCYGDMSIFLDEALTLLDLPSFLGLMINFLTNVNLKDGRAANRVFHSTNPYNIKEINQ